MIEPALAVCMAHRVRISADHVSSSVVQLSDKKASLRKFVMGMTSKIANGQHPSSSLLV